MPKFLKRLLIKLFVREATKIIDKIGRMLITEFKSKDGWKVDKIEKLCQAIVNQNVEIKRGRMFIYDDNGNRLADIDINPFD